MPESTSVHNMADEKSSLRIDLLKIVIDKLLIGGLIVLLGFWTTTLIERYKAKEAFYNELNKVRVSKIAEVWDQAYLLDYRIREFESDWDRLLTDRQKEAQKLIIELTPKIVKDIENPIPQTYDEIEAFNKIFRQRFSTLKETHLNDFNRILHKNRFWLDDESFSVLQEYITVAYGFDILIEMPMEKWEEELLKRRAKIDQLRENIKSVSHRVLIGQD